MKAKTYITDIRAQVRAGHGGEVPKELELTIRNYAAALELRDVYREQVLREPVIIEAGSVKQAIMRQHPLCGLLYQQDLLCMNYAKILGLTAAKAAIKIEPTDVVSKNDPMAAYYEKTHPRPLP